MKIKMVCVAAAAMFSAGTMAMPTGIAAIYDCTEANSKDTLPLVLSVDQENLFLEGIALGLFDGTAGLPCVEQNNELTKDGSSEITLKSTCDDRALDLTATLKNPDEKTDGSSRIRMEMKSADTMELWIKINGTFDGEAFDSNVVLSCVKASPTK